MIKQPGKCDRETVKHIECVYCIRLKKCIQHHTTFHHRCNNLNVHVENSKSNEKQLYNAILVLISITSSYWLFLNDCDIFSSLSFPVIIAYLSYEIDNDNFNFYNSKLLRIILNGSNYAVENYKQMVTISFFILFITHLNEHFLIDTICFLCIFLFIKYIKGYFK